MYYCFLLLKGSHHTTHFRNNGFSNAVTHTHTVLQRDFGFHYLTKSWGQISWYLLNRNLLGFRTGISGAFTFFCTYTF